MTQTLAVFLNRAPLGRLTLEGKDDSYGLEYARSWLESQGYAISPHLPPGGCESGKVKRFLANLLPEGKWLEELSVGHRISQSNVFGLIALLGAETTGALSFHPDGAERELVTTFRVVGAAELTERIAQRQRRSIATWDGKPRLSVAGVQEKLPLLIRPDGAMGFGEGELASTHILKFGRRPELHMPINEFFCMKLAEQIGLTVARVSLRRFGEPVLVVERFDRRWRGETVERLHLIDGCQLLDLPPTYKYERPFGKSGEGARIRTGASLPKLFSACQMCRVPALAIRDLLNWTLFQMLIGNRDAHGKNLSFFVGKAGIDVAPSYDLLNIDIYGDEFERDLALAIGDEFVADKVMPYDLAEFCSACRLPQRQVATSLKHLCMVASDRLESLPLGEDWSGDEIDFAQALRAKIQGNAERLLALAAELPRVKI